MDTDHLLREESASTNEVKSVLIVDNGLGSHQLNTVLTLDRFHELLDLLSVQIPLVNVLVESVKTLGHELGAFLKAHAPFILVMKAIELGLGDCRSLAKFSFAIIMCCPGHVGCSSILSHVMRLNPSPSW
jgi:hypothetical protein